MTNESETEGYGGDTPRGPNGFPYADNDGTHVSRWENGEFHMKVARTDGEILSVNLRETQLKALEKSIQCVRGEQHE